MTSTLTDFLKLNRLSRLVTKTYDFNFEIIAHSLCFPWRPVDVACPSLTPRPASAFHLFAPVSSNFSLKFIIVRHLLFESPRSASRVRRI